jgi:hypothetical protein
MRPATSGAAVFKLDPGRCGVYLGNDSARAFYPMPSSSINRREIGARGSVTREQERSMATERQREIKRRRKRREKRLKARTREARRQKKKR